MPEVLVQQSTSPQVVTKRSGFNWKTVLIVVIIGAVVIGAAAVGLNYYLGQNESSLETGSVTIKSATPSAKTATPSAQQMNTDNWKIYSDARVSFKYPPNFYEGPLHSEGAGPEAAQFNKYFSPCRFNEDESVGENCAFFEVTVNTGLSGHYSLPIEDQGVKASNVVYHRLENLKLASGEWFRWTEKMDQKNWFYKLSLKKDTANYEISGQSGEARPVSENDKKIVELMASTLTAK